MTRRRPLFVAVRPPSTLAAELDAALEPTSCPDLRWSHPDDLHVTLHYLGPTDPEPVVEALDAALAGLTVTAVELGPGLVELGTAVALTAAGLDDLAAQVRSAVEHLGQPPTFPDFLGHLTVGRWTADRRDPSLLARTATASFTAETVDLLATGDQGPDGRYHHLRHWSLAPT